ncbi:methyltransferase family protein [Anaerobacterium chartisolvens]|uniref:Methyltransferase family protein n=1 Tax=Anaerobacterium chartisolvens TaxID=1297424 RepID=A0A369AKI8_9FIRM|nr:class I SAM-dependent methyltransferase [Anaerobacterium chartisolvens]RCX08677.1 methyltransferase family protein [Anaerobacterium chartisolvens]
MILQENATGRPLADANWLVSHHRAKLPERIAFAKRIATLNPKSIVDLGCASGLWFEILNQFLPAECEFIGIDGDEELLNMAAHRSNSWERKVSFLQLDLEHEASRIPPSDLTLAFNIFPYIDDLDSFVDALSRRVPRGTLAIRQYDGASIRFGPMPTSRRQDIEIELRISTESSQRFHHYDLDRTFNALRHSSYQQSCFEFELFERSSPFPIDFIPYYNGTLLWTCQFLSEKSAQYLCTWMDNDSLMRNRYFYEVDLVAILS